MINANEILRALECCSYRECQGEECPYFERANCGATLYRDAATIIKELAEENERLSARNLELSEKGEKMVAAYQNYFVDTTVGSGKSRQDCFKEAVQKMHERIIGKAIRITLMDEDYIRVVDIAKIADELTEEVNENADQETTNI